MKNQRSVYALAAVAALAVSAWGMSGAAQARDVAWSIGVASPGVQFGVSNAPQVVYRQPVYAPQAVVVVQPQPVYYGQAQVVYGQPRVLYGQPQVIYGQPSVVYGQPQVVYGQPQVVAAPQPYYVQSGWAPPVYYRSWGPRHRWHGERWDEHDQRRGFDDGRGYR